MSYTIKDGILTGTCILCDAPISVNTKDAINKEIHAGRLNPNDTEHMERFCFRLAMQCKECSALDKKTAFNMVMKIQEHDAQRAHMLNKIIQPAFRKKISDEVLASYNSLECIQPAAECASLE